MANNSKNKEQSKSVISNFFNSKTKLITASVIGAAILLVIIILMIQEGRYGKFVIKNNTDLDIEYINACFVNDEYILTDNIQTQKISAKSKVTYELTPVDLEGTQSNLELAFKLAGHDEMFTDVGFFNQRFTGNIKVSFNKTSDPNIITIKIKAANGLFQSRNVYCDEEYEIDLAEGIILD